MSAGDDAIRVRAMLLAIGADVSRIGDPNIGVSMTFQADFNEQSLHLMQLIGRRFSILMVADAAEDAEPAAPSLT